MLPGLMRTDKESGAVYQPGSGLTRHQEKRGDGKGDGRCRWLDCARCRSMQQPNDAPAVHSSRYCDNTPLTLHASKL